MQILRTMPTAATSAISLAAIPVQQIGYRLALTKMTTRQLREHSIIERYDPALEFDHPDQGYQRAEIAARHRALAKWLIGEEELRKKVMIPGAIILSIRDTSAEIENGVIRFRTAYLVDGQNRIGGVFNAVERGHKEFDDFEFPVVILLGVGKVDEMFNFSVVNGEQKSVRTDLVNMLLAQIQRHEGESNLSVKDKAKAVLSETTALLNSDPRSTWCGRIIMPGETSAPTELQTVRATSFMAAMRPLEDLMFSKKHSASKPVEQRATELAGAMDAFWSAVKSLPTLGDCFAHPDDYVLLKTPGVFALGLLARWIADQLPVARRNAPDAYRDFLLQSESLQESAYWYAGDKTGNKREMNRGAFANFGSMKGFAQLANDLWTEITSK